MYKKIESKEEILLIALEVAKKEGLNHISIRDLAMSCNISIGTIYNYFPSKTELLVEIIESIWLEIFHNNRCDYENSGFINTVEWFYDSVKQGTKEFPNFLKMHSSAFMNNQIQSGESLMIQYFKHIKMGFKVSFDNDKDIKSEKLDDNLNEEALIDFVFWNIVSSLQNGRDIHSLKLVIKKLVY